MLWNTRLFFIFLIFQDRVFLCRSSLVDQAGLELSVVIESVYRRHYHLTKLFFKNILTCFVFWVFLGGGVGFWFLTRSCFIIDFNVNHLTSEADTGKSRVEDWPGCNSSGTIHPVQ